jgi:PAS domain S-box-containing protein
LLKGQEKTVEYRIQTKDGQIRWMLDYAKPVWDEKTEQVAFIYGAAQDITERRQAEEELRASEWRFRTLVEQSPFGIQVFDSEGTLEQANYAWEEIWGIQADEMIGRLNALQDAQIQESKLLPSIQQSFAGEAVSLPDTLYDPAASGLPGRKRWIRTNAYPVKDQDGHVLKVVVINQDVSKQKIVEQALKESENKFRSITENAIDYIFIKDKDRKYTFANNAMQDLLGLPEDEILGKTPDEVFGTKQATAIKNVDDRAFSGEVVNETRSLVIKDQTLYLNTIQTPLTMNNGEVTSIMGIVRDVTEQMRAEEALRASEEQYRTLFEHANDAIFLENDDDQIIDVNQQACELMGYTRDELLQMTVPDLQAPEVRGKKGTVLKQEMENYRGELFESLNLHRDGTKIPVEISTASLPGKDTGLVLAIIRDITERKRIDLEIRDNASRMGALLEIEKALTSTLDLDEVLDIIMTEMEKVIPYHSISLQILQNNSLKILACRGFDQPNNVIELSFPLDPKYPNHHVIKTREALAIEDVAQEYPHFQSQSTRYMSGHIRCWLGVPLISKGKVDGMITLDRSEAIPFSKAEIQLATAIASQAALAIENASLFSEAQLRLERLSSLRRIDQTISSSMDLQVTLGILLEQVLHQLKIDAAAVLLFRPELQSLQFIAGQGFHTQALQFTDLRLGQGFAGRAALEQRTVKVNDLATTQTGFLRSPEFRTEGFVTYIGVPLIAKGNITGVLEIYHRQNLEPDLEWMVFLETLAGQAAIAIDNIRLFEDLQTSNLQLRQAYDATIEGWAQALELRDMETKGHSHRAVELTQALARKMGIGDRKLAHIRWGVLLHDIGKMGVPDAILQKNGPLTEEEWEIMREHPLHAYKWLAPISYLRPALDIPYYHHEKWNGTGYPQGLKEERIPLSARIFAVVDVWDALLSDRPYRKAWTQKKALAYLREQSGQHFDPQVVEAFIEMLLHEGHLT